MLTPYRAIEVHVAIEVHDAIERRGAIHRYGAIDQHDASNEDALVHQVDVLPGVVELIVVDVGKWPLAVALTVTQLFEAHAELCSLRDVPRGIGTHVADRIKDLGGCSSSNLEPL